MVEIRSVEKRSDLRRFVHFPYLLFKDHPYWCPPLKIDEYRTLRSDRNAAFDFCEAKYWLAYRQGRIVGRIAGIINHKANQRWDEKLVRFGWIDFIDDPEVSDALVGAVEAWGRSKGMTGIHGPLGFTDMDREGMTIEGFEEMTNISSIYNPPYYPVHMNRLGFVGAVHSVQYEFDISPTIPDKVKRMASMVSHRYNLRVLKVKRAGELLPYALKMFQTLNVAFDTLYGYSALSEDQMKAYIRQYFGYIRPEFVAMVVNGNDDVAGFGISMPSLTRALQRSGGRLFPLGWYHILRAMRHNDVVDMYLVGVHPEYQGKGVAAMIWESLHQNYLKYGIRKAVSNPQLENNIMALSIWKNYQGRRIIRRRCWKKIFQQL